MRIPKNLPKAIPDQFERSYNANTRYVLHIVTDVQSIATGVITEGRDCSMGTTK